jgi:hypothetical protein
MISLEQIRLLESRITRALELIRVLKEENSTLRRGLESAQKRMRELEALVDGLKTDQREIESIIVRTLHNLDDLEETAAGGASGAAAGGVGAAGAGAGGAAGTTGTGPSASRRGDRPPAQTAAPGHPAASPAAPSPVAASPATADKGDREDASLATGQAQGEELDIF